MTENDENFIRSDTKDFAETLTFEKRKKLNSIEQLILFNHKIKKKQNAMKKDPLTEYKVKKSK